MAETTELATQAGAILDQAFEAFKRAQLEQSKVELFDNAEVIFAMQEMTTATRMYLFDDVIAQKVVELGPTVLTMMSERATQTEFLKVNFTGNDIRWLLDLPRTHRRQR